jgi:hypothetical protein
MRGFDVPHTKPAVPLERAAFFLKLAHHLISGFIVTSNLIYVDFQYP